MCKAETELRALAALLGGRIAERKSPKPRDHLVYKIMYVTERGIPKSICEYGYSSCGADRNLAYMHALEYFKSSLLELGDVWNN